MIHNGSSEPHTDDWKETARQLETELAILLAVEQWIRVALQWMTRGRGNGHKLSTLCSTARSYERHLTRTRVLADHGGYMRSITDANPHLASDVNALRDRRKELQGSFERIILQLENVSPDDRDACEGVCAELETHLDQLNVLGHKEAELLQHSFTREEGGSG